MKNYRSREEHSLSCRWAGLNNLLDLFKETLIQKPVSLVKDQHLNALQAEAGSVLDVIDKTETNINYVMIFFFSFCLPPGFDPRISWAASQSADRYAMPLPYVMIFNSFYIIEL